MTKRVTKNKPNHINFVWFCGTYNEMQPEAYRILDLNHANISSGLDAHWCQLYIASVCTDMDNVVPSPFYKYQSNILKGNAIRGYKGWIFAAFILYLSFIIAFWSHRFSYDWLCTNPFISSCFTT